MEEIYKGSQDQDYSSGNVEGLKNQAKDLLLYIMKDPDMTCSGENVIEQCKTSDEVLEYMDILCNPETGKPVVDFLGDVVHERQKALDACSWLTDKQREKIKITLEYIEIDGIKLKLHDETEKMTFNKVREEGIRTPSYQQWFNSIASTILGSREQKAQFFRTVLKMERDYYWYCSIEDKDIRAMRIQGNPEIFEVNAITEAYANNSKYSVRALH